MAEFPDIIIAIGESDEFSFVFKRSSAAYKRRIRFGNVPTGKWIKFFPAYCLPVSPVLYAPSPSLLLLLLLSKIVSSVVSIFSANFVFHWSNFLPTVKLKYPPTFDGRVVAYPTDQNIRDYLSWRQVDCESFD